MAGSCGSVACGSGEDVAMALGSRGSSSINAWRRSRVEDRVEDTGLLHADVGAW